MIKITTHGHKYSNQNNPTYIITIPNIYKFYDGSITYNQIKNFLKTVDSYSLHKKSRVLKYNPMLWMQKIRG